MPPCEYQILLNGIIVDRQYTKRDHEDFLKFYNQLNPIFKITTKTIKLYEK